MYKLVITSLLYVPSPVPFLPIQHGEGGEYKGISVAFMISYDSCLGGFITILIIASLLGTVLGESIMAVTPVGEFPQALEYNPSNN